jgi:hypothetical protein
MTSMREALAALTRTPSLLDGFGLERLTLREDLWQERLAIQGPGRAVLSTLRSFGDESGEEVGRYQTSLGRAHVAELIRAVELTLAGGPSVRLSPGDVRIMITVVACGARLQRTIGGLPPALEPYQPLLLALDRTASEVRKHPQTVLQLDLELPVELASGPQTIPVVLSFKNRGSEGAWIRNPASGMEGQSREHVRLWHAERPVEEPGVTPLLPAPSSVPLDPTPPAERPLLWLGPGETEARQFVAQVDLPCGTHLVRASFASYGGEDAIGGQHLLRGCVFSGEQVVEVS